MYSHIRISSVEDVRELSNFFLSQPEGYLKYFFPFEFDIFTLLDELLSGNLYRVILLDEKIVAFFMLRYSEEHGDFSHGMVTDHNYQNCGLASLGLLYCKAWLKVNKLNPIIVTRVDPNNQASYHLAVKHGNKLI